MCSFYFRTNPYQKVIQILGRTLEPFVEYGHVYAYGFGDAVSQDVDVFNLIGTDDTDDEGKRACHDFRQGTKLINPIFCGIIFIYITIIVVFVLYIIVLSQYNIAVRRVSLSGPTSFAPIIRKAVDLVIGSNNQVKVSISK